MTGRRAARLGRPAWGATLLVCAGLAAPAHADEKGAEAWPWGDPLVTPSFLEVPPLGTPDARPAPSLEEAQALAELEDESLHFSAGGAAYRESVLATVRRAYLRQRRLRSQGYAQQISEEEVLADASTGDAIEDFERFLAEYPGDPKLTPDVMFRLGELYFDRSSVAFRDAMTAMNAARARGEEVPEPDKELGPTIALYQDLIARFPGYAHIDGVYYLTGYCLNETGKVEAARQAWLSFVCANRFSFADALSAPRDGKRARSSGPASYDGCTAAVKDSELSSEAWLRVGEQHFDLEPTDAGLASAVSAYRQVLENPADRNYDLALYKLAWSYYRASHYREAVQTFAKLVDFADQQQKSTGKAGSELRSEAIQYLGIALAWEDWNDNQVPDAREGQATPVERLRDPALLKQDQPYTSAVYDSVAIVLFDEAKYDLAIAVWQLSLERWPLSPEAPARQNSIARAYNRAGEFGDGVAARAKLTSYAEGSPWWNANLEKPREQRRAEELAEVGLVNDALFHHQEAQRLRGLSEQGKNPENLRAAQEEYGLAAKAYRAYVERYPNSPQAYGLQYNLADALFWSGDYTNAAREYAVVRDSQLDDEYLADAARRVEESYKRLIEQAQARGELTQRTEPPTPAGSPPQMTPVQVPALVQELARSRELYLARVDEAHDKEQLRDVFAYNNALLLYHYGYWYHARERFTRLYEGHCKGASADQSGRDAWLNLRNMAVALAKLDEVERLGADLRSRACTFTKDQTQVAVLDCTDPKNAEQPQCLAGSDLTNIQYQRAVAVFQQAEAAKKSERGPLYEQAATLLVQAVDDDPDHPQAPLALEKAAIALERTSRFDSAARLYSRIIEEVGPRKATSPEEQASLDAILANAYFRLAFNANRVFDFDRAVENYRILADSERFKKSSDPKMGKRREDALINAAKILEYQQEYARAAEYYQRAAEILSDPNDKRAAYFRVAEMSFKQKDYRGTITAMQAFIKRSQGDNGAGELVVQAYYRIAEAQAELGRAREHAAALTDVTRAFERSGLEPGSLAAEYAARAQFALADSGLAAFESFKIEPGSPATLKAYVDSVKKQIDGGATAAKQRNEGYDAVMTYRRPAWTIAAYARQGRVYEILAKATLDTPFVVPADMKKQMAKLPEESREDVRLQVEDTIHQVLDEQVQPIECFAVVRYALAARAAKVASLDNEYTQQAIARLGAYGDERIAQCIAEQQGRDASLAAYKPGEFSRAPPGQVLPLPEGVAPPALKGARP